MAAKSISGKAVLAKATASEKAKRGKGDGDKYGKTTGLLLTHAVNALLRANATAKQPDTELQAWLHGEFANRKAVQAISAYRAYANRGLHGHDGGERGIPLLGKGKKAESYGRLDKATRDAHVVFSGPRETTPKKAVAKKATGGKRTAKKATAKKATRKPKRASKGPKRATRS